LCADGFIIRAQAMIRADGFRPRKLGEGLRAARANSGRAGFGTRCAGLTTSNLHGCEASVQIGRGF
jgi:hypothetical protein